MKKVEGNWKTAIKLQVVMVPTMGLLSHVGVLLRQLDGLSWFLAWRLPVLHCVIRNFRTSPKIRILPSDVVSPV